MNNESDSSQTRRRLSREDMDRYRNDSRFTNILATVETEEKRKRRDKSRSIKVGGIRLTPKRIMILCGFFIIVLLCLFGSLFYAIKDVSKFKKYSDAVSLFDAGKYEEAREKFISVLSEDPNKEGAIEAMAQIYHHFGDWGNEAFFRQRIMRLNPLNKQYYRDFLDAAFRARNFGSIYSLLSLKVMENPDLPPEEGALYVISALHSGHVSNAKSFFKDRTKEKASYFSGTEFGRYAKLLLNAAEITDEQARLCVASLEDIKDLQVRFETINTMLAYYAKRGGPGSDEMIEKLLIESVRLNEFAGAPLLANYYFTHYRFADAIRVCEEYFNTKMNAILPIIYGDSCLLSGKPELIPPFADKMRNLHGRQSKIIASYLDALYAFHEGDEPRLRSAMLETGSTISTPLSSLIKLQLAAITGSSKEIFLLLGEIVNGHPFLDFLQRARTIALEYLVEQTKLNQLSDPEHLNACAEIAALISTPDDDVSFLKRIILLDRFKRKSLKEEELLSAMNDYPDDPVLLRIAAEYYLKQGKPARSMECISAYNALEVEDKESLAILHILALDQLGRKDEAEKEFRGLAESGEDSSVFFYYFDFCIENKMLDSLNSLASWLESLPDNSPKRSLLPFVQAEILLSEGKEDQALALFEKTPSSDPRFVFHAATRLAEAGRNSAAFNRYNSIKDTYPDTALVNVNLSELYFGKGDVKNALACAKTAWEEDQNDLLSRYIYGKRLFELEQYADAIAVLKFPQYKASFPKEMTDLWAKAMREEIKMDFEKERYIPAMENAKHFLTYFPEDKSVQDYLENIQKLRRHKGVSGEGK